MPIENTVVALQITNNPGGARAMFSLRVTYLAAYELRQGIAGQVVDMVRFFRLFDVPDGLFNIVTP